MPTRREVLRRGLGALVGFGAASALPKRLLARPLAPRAPAGIVPPAAPPFFSDPILRIAALERSELVGGVPFAPQWFGDVFPDNAIPFHSCESCDRFPAPQESIEVAIVGGGLSGLTSALMLRDRDTVLFELRPRTGGNAMGEAQGGRAWSLGSAYFMQPDPGTRIEALYDELNLASEWRQDDGTFSFEFDGEVGTDLLGPDPDPTAVRALAAYQAAVEYFACEAYPEIPFDEPSREVSELDLRTFKDDLLLRCGSLPPRLEYILQAYCYSSFGVGFDELSAAAGWNFVAAEEFGRNILPGGNAGLARAIWKAAHRPREGGPGVPMRTGSLVASIEPVRDGSILRWRTPDGELRSTHARQVILANAKHIARHMMPWLAETDPEKFDAMHQVPTAAYLVANVLLSRGIDQDFYDLFLGGGRTFPLDGNAFEFDRVVTDAVNAGFATAGSSRALTLYWPLPWHTARFSIVEASDWRSYAELLVPQLEEKLGIFGLGLADVQQVRMTRWGHAMPYAVPGKLTSGPPQELRRPLNGNIWFANQDNWLLPAVETAFEEAFWVTDQVRERLPP